MDPLSRGRPVAGVQLKLSPTMRARDLLSKQIHGMSEGVAISLFSGAGGLDLGVEAAGFRTAVAVEWDEDAADTMEKNAATFFPGLVEVLRADLYPLASGTRSGVKTRDGARLHRLVPDPVAAPVVARIFTEYVAGRGMKSIAEGLTADGIPSPAAHDPERNKHRQGNGGAWVQTAVRVILDNPRYTGRQVWNKQRRDEVLMDIEDVAMGYETKMRWNDKGEWVFSAERTHEALVSDELFEQAAIQRAAAAKRYAVVRPRRKHVFR